MNIVAPMFKVKYKFSGKEYNSVGFETDRYSVDYSFDGVSLKASIKAKVYLELISTEIVFDYKFNDNDRFFSNGYQSWTTSREYKKGEKMPDITPVALSKLRNLAGISADCRFVNPSDTLNSFYSHCYTYIRNGDEVDFIGSLSEKQGFTVIKAFMNYNDNLIAVYKDVEGVNLKDGEEYPLYNLVTFKGLYDEVFDRYFELMKLPEPRVNHLSGYTSWYNYFQKIDEKIILRDLNAMDKVSDSVSVFQIDDGYETFVGDWLDDCDKFPNGMKFIADCIHEKGYKAGIWLAPFNVQIKSRTYREHPDWVVKDEKGRPVLGCAGWGGAFTLDLYNPEVREHIKHFFNVILNEWGYDMVKLDFLYSECMYPRNGKSRGNIMCDAMAFLRECCADKIILGCGVPLGAAFGYIDCCRIGCDVDLAFKGKFYNALGVNNEIPSAKNSIINAVFRRHLNNRAFCSDPDVFFLRYSNLKFDKKQKMLLGTINHIFGSVLFVSDNVNEYNNEDVKALEYFFKESDDIKVISAEFINEDKIAIKLEFNGKTDIIWFSLKTGENNIKSVLGVV